MNRHLEKHYIKLPVLGKIIWDIVAIIVSASIALAVVYLMILLF